MPAPGRSATMVARLDRPRTMRLLVVEDEQKVAEALREGLEGEGYDVTLEHTGEGAFFRATTERFDAILLDVAKQKAVAK